MGIRRAAAMAEKYGGKMLKARVIPCLDCDGGRVVKGVRFANLRDAGDPVELSARYEADGADELVILDISATTESRQHRLDTIRGIRAEVSIPVTAGGGVRSVEDCEALLSAGADKISINTAALLEPDLLDRIAARFGNQCAVLAIDARQCDSGWRVLANSGKTETPRSAVAWAIETSERGAGEILLTSWDKDGTRSGYDLELLTAITAAVKIPVIASGGAANAQHLAEAFAAGASGLLAASLFHDGDYSILEIKQELQSFGVPVRL
jgi:imidazole glycerol-phosphate synthase subunit HisF